MRLNYSRRAGDKIGLFLLTIPVARRLVFCDGFSLAAFLNLKAADAPVHDSSILVIRRVNHSQQP